jgi:hypothetical protein
LKPAVKTRPHHRGGTIRPKQPINKTTGINKLGTLLSSQTTDTIRIIPGTNPFNNSNEFRVPYFSAAMFTAYFIHFHFANPGNSPGIHPVE